MTTYQAQSQIPTNTIEPLPEWELDYATARLRSRLYQAVLAVFDAQASEGKVNKAILAKRLNKDASQITRWLQGPGNWTLDTVSTLLLGMEAELDPAVSFFADKRPANYAHPLAREISTDDFFDSNIVIIGEEKAAGSEGTLKAAE